MTYDLDDEDDDFDLDDSGFAEDHSVFQSRSLFPPPSSSPFALRTPVKQSHHSADTVSRPVLTVKTTNSPYLPPSTVGTKRKPAPTSFVTPERKHTLTPLQTTSSCAFDRLAPPPLSAPRFGTRTPHTKAETEKYLKSGEDSLTRLRIMDHDMATLDSSPDSSREGGTGDGESSLFTDRANTSKNKAKRPAGPSPFAEKGAENEDEVVESMSPGGHVNKRRARSRPVSRELLLSASNTPMLKETSVRARLHARFTTCRDTSARQTKAGTPRTSVTKSTASVPFPSSVSARRFRRTSGSSASSAEAGSPRQRTRRSSGTTGRATAPKRAPLNRNAARNVSAATLFFGPAIPKAEDRSRKESSGAMSIDTPPAKAKSSVASPSASPWKSGGVSSPSEDEQIDAFFSSPPEKSFSFDVTESTPSPSKSRLQFIEKLPVKFRARDSGIALDADSSDDDGRPGLLSSSAQGSGSLSSIYSESDGEALVTPGFGPGPESGWPSVDIVNLDDELSVHGELGPDAGVDAFILRTLTAQSKSSVPIPGEPQRVPGTPVKRFKTTHLINRPWQSAVTSKIGLPEFDPPPQEVDGSHNDKRGKPRKSLPAAFFVPATAKETRTRKDALNFGHLGADEDDEASPSTRKQVKYIKRPPVPLFANKDGSEPATKPPSWMMRKTSSGAVSSGGSDTTISQAGTPTRRDALGKRFFNRRDTDIHLLSQIRLWPDHQCPWSSPLCLIPLNGQAVSPPQRLVSLRPQTRQPWRPLQDICALQPQMVHNTDADAVKGCSISSIETHRRRKVLSRLHEGHRGHGQDTSRDQRLAAVYP